MGFIAGIFIALILYLIATNIRVVAQAHCYIIERLGRYYAVWPAGLHLKVPFIDRIVSKMSLKEQVLDFPPQSVITKDNVSMLIDSVVYARIFDPQRYTYGVENAMVGLQNLTATTLRSVIGDMELDQTLSSRAEINAQMQDILDKATDEWGIKVTRVEIKNIQPPKEIEEVMTKQMRAERERRQTVLEAQAHQEAVVSRAEGDKRAKVLNAEAERDAQIALAEGRAQAIERVYTAEAEGISKLNSVGVHQDVLQLRSIEAMKDIADGQATKIFIPNNLADSLVSVGTAGDVFFGTKPSKPSIPRAQKQAMAASRLASRTVAEDACIKPDTSAESRRAAMTNARTQAGNKVLGDSSRP